MGKNYRRIGNKTKLTDIEADLIRLIDRSDADLEGWRAVSSTLWPHVKKYAVPDLVELMERDTGGSVRFTERGAVIRDYL